MVNIFKCCNHKRYMRELSLSTLWRESVTRFCLQYLPWWRNLIPVSRTQYLQHNLSFPSMLWLDLLKPTTVKSQPRFCQAFWAATKVTNVMVPVKRVLFDVCGHLVVICNNDVVLFRLLVGCNESLLAYDLNRVTSNVLWLVVTAQRLVFRFSNEFFSFLLSNLMVASKTAVLWLKAVVTDVFMLKFVKKVVVGC